MSDFWKRLGQGVMYATNPTTMQAGERMGAIKAIAPGISEQDRQYMALGISPPKSLDWDKKAQMLSQIFPSLDPTTKAYMAIGMRPPSVGGSGSPLDYVMAQILTQMMGNMKNTPGTAKNTPPPKSTPIVKQLISPQGAIEEWSFDSEDEANQKINEGYQPY